MEGEKTNEKYYSMFQEFLAVYHKNGIPEHTLLLDYLSIRDAELKSCEIKSDRYVLYGYLKMHKNNYYFYDFIFDNLKRKVESRVKKAQEKRNAQKPL